jgi:hypothetical protein
MPKQFPKVKTRTEHRTRSSILLAGLGGLAFAGAIYGLFMWCLLFVLRHTGIISDVVPYRWCVVISYIYVLYRWYDKQMFSANGSAPRNEPKSYTTVG